MRNILRLKHPLIIIFIAAFTVAIAPTALYASESDIAHSEVEKTLVKAATNQDDSEAREQLAVQCSKFPETFSSIIRNEPDQTKRWMAVYAVRTSAQTKCDNALIAVFNNPVESQELRIQIVMCLIQATQLPQNRLQPFLPGLNLLLKERPRPCDLERVIQLAGFLGDKSSIPLLIPLLDDKKVHSYTVQSGGARVANTISKTAYAALQEITGRHGIAPDRSAWEAIR